MKNVFEVLKTLYNIDIDSVFEIPRDLGSKNIRLNIRVTVKGFYTITGKYTNTFSDIALPNNRVSILLMSATAEGSSSKDLTIISSW